MKRSRFLINLICLFLLGATALSSCHSSKQSFAGDDPIYARHSEFRNKKNEPQKEGKGHYSRPDVKAGKKEQRVIDAACAWIGVPYKYGGNTPSGVDCSGLVCMAFETGAGIKLPRTSSEQADFCRKVSRNKAKPGDLVFFVNTKGGRRINHVALYLGENRVVHSTSSRGVIISSLDDDYWKTHLHSYGRVF